MHLIHIFSSTQPVAESSTKPKITCTAKKAKKARDQLVVSIVGLEMKEIIRFQTRGVYSLHGGDGVLVQKQKKKKEFIDVIGGIFFIFIYDDKKFFFHLL